MPGPLDWASGIGDEEIALPPRHALSVNVRQMTRWLALGYMLPRGHPQSCGFRWATSDVLACGPALRIWFVFGLGKCQYRFASHMSPMLAGISLFGEFAYMLPHRSGAEVAYLEQTYPERPAICHGVKLASSAL